MRWRFSVICSVVLAILGGGCQLRHRSAITGPSFADLPDPTSEATKRLSQRIIHTGESLSFNFQDPDGAQESIVMHDIVKQDGTVTLLSNRVFNAAGRTISELEREIGRYYGPKLYRNWQTEPLPYRVDGEVKAPGLQSYIGPLTISQAIRGAGGFTKSANQKKVQLIRSHHTYVINCTRTREDPALDMKIFPGDEILVPHSLWKW